MKSYGARDNKEENEVTTFLPNNSKYKFVDDLSPVADILYDSAAFSQITTTNSESVILSFGSLWFLIFAAILYTGLAMLQIMLLIFSDKDANIPIYIETMTRVGNSELILFVVKHVGKANVFVINATYIGITGGFYMYYAYIAYRYKKITSTRWRYLEFALAQSVMYLLLLLELGSREIVTVLLVFSSGICTMIFGYMQDKLAGETSIKWGMPPQTWGFFPFFATWLALSIPFYINLSSTEVAVPGYVIMLYLIQFFTLPLFGITQYFYIVIPFSRGDNKLNRYAQKKYDGLFHLFSMASKLSLLSISTYGILTESGTY